MANRKNSRQDNAVNVFRKSAGRPAKHRQLRAIALSIAIGILVFAVVAAIYVCVAHFINGDDQLNNSNDGGRVMHSPSLDDLKNMYMPAEKPIIYLYPTADTNVTVKLGKPEKLTVSYPTYDASTGWRVLAKPSGELVDLSSGRSLYALYYESNLLNDEFKVEEDGFIVRRENVASFLEDKLARLGLNEREAEEFIVYWLPRLSEHKYNYIRFATVDEINEAMPLEINPAPDTIIRVLMTYKGLDEPLAGVKEQQLPGTPTRTGFTAAEWGGSEIRD